MRTLACSKCGSLLEVDYANPTPFSNTIPLPLHQPLAAMTLGEGNTPTIRIPAVGGMAGLERLFMKLESSNPTGSFKDRGTAIMMSAAVEQGVTEIVEDSSGNAGASVAAYAARAGIKAHVFAPTSAPKPKLDQIAVYGAQLHTIEGPRDLSTSAAMRFVQEHDLVYASHSRSPFFVEGVKQFAHEVMEQMADHLPDHLVIPVGNGLLLMGAYKGFEELVMRGKLPRIPKFHAVQTKAVMPLVAAFNKQPWSKDQASPTLAGGIAVTDPPHIHRLVSILRETDGQAVAVRDEEILYSQRLLAEQQGIFAEPTSATALAGLQILVSDGLIDRTDTILVPITGSGLKDVPPSRRPNQT